MFKNEPFTDFTIKEERERLAKALATLESQLSRGPLKAAPIFGGATCEGSERFQTVDPSNTEINFGQVGFASVQDAERAIQVLESGRSKWAARDSIERSKVLKTAANLMRRDKHALSALLIREVAKTWKEADADVAEAIDFCDYYAEQWESFSKPVKTQEVPGEDNFYFYQPRGIVAVIAPWNFPFAIACGMTVAALVTGNTVALKPAEQSSVIAQELIRILYEAGVPSDALAFLPARGETVGRYLVEHPKIDMICFTGSKAVGLEIIRSASVVRDGQRSIKKVVAELGGKNAVIVDEDADLDEAIKGIIHSAFGFAGQKCSALSRLIVVGQAYDTLLARLGDAVKDLIVGEPKNSDTFLSPVIDKNAHERILSVISEASSKFKIVGQSAVKSSGYFVPATIFRDVDDSAFIWNQEIFGPVVACRNVATFDQALQLANSAEYALTGGLYSRNPANIEKAKREFKVGNLYINRGCTGALVCRQPFGGFKMSGVGSKAGGPDYLIQFVEPRTISENTVRRGFAPL